MAKTHPVEAELVKASKTKYTSTDRAEQLTQLRTGVRGLEDAAFEKLSAPAQEWANAAEKAIAKKKPVPDFVAASETEADDAAGDAEPETETKPAKKAPVAKAAKTAPKTEAAPVKTAKAAVVTKTPKKNGASDLIKAAILKKPAISGEELLSKLETAGLNANPSTVQTIASDFRHSLGVLIGAKMIDEKFGVRPPRAKKD